MEPDEAEQPHYFTVFHLCGLLLGLGAVAVAIRAGWDAGGVVGLLAGAAIAVVLAPVGLAVGFAVSLAAALLLVFFGCDTPPPGVWPGRVHKAVRGLVIAACLAWIVRSVPQLRATPDWKGWKDEALLGVFLPICTIFMLYMSRIERYFQKPRESD